MDTNKLAQMLLQYIGDASPGGLLNPEVPPGGPTALAKGLLGFVPGVGDAISGYDAIQSAREGNYGEAALNAVGLLPFVPSLGGMTQIIRKDVKPVAEDIAKRINDAGFLATVEHSGSAAGASSYIRAGDPQTGRFITDPLRVSDHSKGPFNNQFNRNVSDTGHIDDAVGDYVTKLNELRNLGPSSGLLAQQQREAEIFQKTLLRARQRRDSGKTLRGDELGALQKAGEI